MAALSLLLLLIGRREPQPKLLKVIKANNYAKDSIKIVEDYRYHGYLEIQIKRENFDDSTRIYVYEGTRYRIGSIIISGSSIRKSVISEDLGIVCDSYYSKSDLEEGIKKVLQRHLNNGHPFCKIKPIITKTASDKIEIRLNIDEGPMVELTDLKYRGGKTKSWAIKRWVKFKPVLFSQKKVDHWVNQIEKLDYIKSITQHIIHSQEDYSLILSGEELASELIEVGGSYHPDQNRFLVILSLKLKNILGTMRELSVNWESSKKIEVNYIEPWLIYPISIEIHLRDQWFDSLRVGRGEISFNTHGFKAYAGLERGDRIDEFIGLGLKRKHQRDSIGTFIEFVRMQPNRSHIKMGFGSKKRVTPFEFGLNLRHTTISNPQIVDYFQTGGIDDLRGYWPDEFYFQTGGWSNIELKFTDLLFPFYDVGYLDKKWFSAAGIASQIMGRNLGLKLAIGIPIWEPYQAKIHARLLGRL